MISIHAPLTGSDNRSVFGNFRARYFNPRSPHRERLVTAAESGRKRDFNPRSPHRERRKLSKVTVTAYYFNPRSPHRERPSVIHTPATFLLDFNPRSPHRERQKKGEIVSEHFYNFNPRSPHRERLRKVFVKYKFNHFNPRSPHRERRWRAECHSGTTQFQSTLPSQGATASHSQSMQTLQISIHAPLTGSDRNRHPVHG